MDQPIPMPLLCPDCTAEMPATAAFCPGCGRSMDPVTSPALELVEEIRAQGKVGLLSEALAGALAYLTFVPALIFLALKPYNKNQFVRFHSIQCLLFWVATLATVAALKLAGIVLFMIPRVGPLFVLLLSVVAALAAVVIWLVLVVKALQGQMFKLPALGDYAEQHAVAL